MVTGRHAARIAAMRERFVIEQPVETPDAAGGASIVWVAGPAFWGRIEARGGREPVVGERVEPGVATRITLRFRTGLSAGMRLRAGSRLFSIRAAFDPDGQRERLVLEAEEIAP
jgi:head-tail adaptor